MIQATNLTKRFNGNTAVNAVSLNIDKGKIFGLLGPNAAGKTTVIRMLCGIIESDAGEIKINNVSVIVLPDEDSKRLAALVVAPGMQASDILEQLKPSIEPACLPRPIYIVPMLPRQETGKLARKIIVELFEKMRRARAQQDDESPSNQTH